MGINLRTSKIVPDKYLISISNQLDCRHRCTHARHFQLFTIQWNFCVVFILSSKIEQDTVCGLQTGWSFLLTELERAHTQAEFGLCKLFIHGICFNKHSDAMTFSQSKVYIIDSYP